MNEKCIICINLIILNEWMIDLLYVILYVLCVIVILIVFAALLDEKEKKFHPQLLWICSLMGLSRAAGSTEVDLGA